MVDLILPGQGAGLVRVLGQRRGRPTRLRLRDGRDVVAHNCAWGMDYAGVWEHLTVNLSPRVPGAEVASLSSADVMVAADVATGCTLYARGGEAGARPSHSRSPGSGVAA